MPRMPRMPRIFRIVAYVRARVAAYTENARHPRHPRQSAFATADFALRKQTLPRRRGRHKAPESTRGYRWVSMVPGCPGMENTVMANKRKRTRMARQTDVLSKPSPWRRQHDEFGPASYDTDPDTGAVVTHHRAVDTLGRMLTNGTITKEMYDAGMIFRAHFRGAAIGNMATSPLHRLPGRALDGMSEHSVDARMKIAAAIVALGGHESAAASCAWYVVGDECSVREWSMRQGWRGRPIPTAQAQGMLVVTLGVLAGHYGLTAQSHAA